MSTQREGLAARDRVPNLDRFVEASGRQSLSIRLPRRRRDAVGVSEWADDHLFRGDVPDLRREIATGRGDSGTVRAPYQMVDHIDMSAQRNKLVAGMSARDRHRPILMSGGEEFVVRTPCPCANTAWVGYVLGRPVSVGVPYLDRAILSPGGQPHSVRAISHGHNRGVPVRRPPPRHEPFRPCNPRPAYCRPGPTRSIGCPKMRLPAQVRAE